jgi:isopenicillin-N epimerase
MRQHWTLDPEIVFLNHGSFGACPIPVLEAQARFRAELEREPVQFFDRLLGSELERARGVAAAFVGARTQDFVFVRNSTAGVNAVLRSLEFERGDALLTTDHVYNACRNTLEYVARRMGVEVIVVQVPLPIRHPEDVLARILDAVTPRVRLALIDHVTSHTGLVFPLAAIVRELRERGIETLVDGAHGPGMVEVDFRGLGAGYYAGNFHKWVSAPKGAAMLCVREDLQADLHPISISHGLARQGQARFLDEFAWTGTDDPSSWLCVPEAIAFFERALPGGFPELRMRNRALALQARRLLAGALGVEPPAPESMIGSLAALPLPDGNTDGAVWPRKDPLYEALFERHRIEVPVFSWPKPPRRLIRVSAQLYNTIDDYHRLAAALRTELSCER